MSVPTVCNSTIPLSVTFIFMTHHYLVYKHLPDCEVVIHVNYWCLTWQVIELSWHWALWLKCDYWCNPKKSLQDFRSVFVLLGFTVNYLQWRAIVCSLFKTLFTSRETRGQKEKHTAQSPISPHNQNNVPSAWIEKDISETSFCYLKEVGRRSNTSKISPA